MERIGSCARGGLADDFGDFDAVAVFDDHDFAAGDEFAVDAQSTGASAGLSSWTTEPMLSWSTSRMGSLQPPSSMVRLTGTSSTRFRLEGFSSGGVHGADGER